MRGRGRENPAEIAETEILTALVPPLQPPPVGCVGQSQWRANPLGASIFPKIHCQFAHGPSLPQIIYSVLGNKGPAPRHAWAAELQNLTILLIVLLFSASRPFQSLFQSLVKAWSKPFQDLLSAHHLSCGRRAVDCHVAGHCGDVHAFN